MNTIRLLISAVDPLARSALSMLVGSSDMIEVVAQINHLAADSSQPWDDFIDIYRPDVVLWDLGWEGAPPNEELREMGELGVPVVALVPDEALVEGLVGVGVSGILPRDCRARQLTVALQAVMQEMVVTDQSFQFRSRSTLTAPLIRPDIPALTPRESDVLNLVATGLTNKAIGQELNISAHTVKFHITAIMGKLDAQSRTEAVVLATRYGLLTI